MRATNLPKRSGSCRIWKTILGFGGDKHGRLHKYWHYLFVISILIILLSVLAMLNAYFHLINVSSYNINKEGVSQPFLLAGYLGMFISVAIFTSSRLLYCSSVWLSIIDRDIQSILHVSGVPRGRRVSDRVRLRQTWLDHYC